MIKDIHDAIRHLIFPDGESFSGIDVSSQLIMSDRTEQGIARNLNAAFLISLSGSAHPNYEEAKEYLESFGGGAGWEKTAAFLRYVHDLMLNEVREHCDKDPAFAECLHAISLNIHNKNDMADRMEMIEKYRSVFFPEGLGICDDKAGKRDALRERRAVNITQLNQGPVEDPGRELLLTSNILLTIPPASADVEDLPLSSSLREKMKKVIKEDQSYWYDHPVQIGVDIAKNEAIYGIEGLDEAVAFEKRRGTLPDDAKLDCVLSVSTTHEGLRDITKEYLEEEFAKGRGTQHLNIYIFTEKDTKRLLDEIIIPAVEHYRGDTDSGILYDIIGVDGEYGRHYSFLKAVAVFWKVFIHSDIKGTFKIDLDQVFPQEELLEQTGMTAFQHLGTPLWGAKGIDIEGDPVELGMIAGALVNERDICTSLFRPDVCFPPEEIRGEDLIFYSTLPQALSTEAEMMTRYIDGPCNGKDRCIQRIHVTGGTCGILVDSLRKYRPFTPTFIGRAEDQAYLLSVLYKGKAPYLRYVHKDGLIMRHDKDIFAQEAIETASMGKLVGDYVRILLFSYYARALPWSFSKTKQLIDPFTGCFVSAIPFTVVMLRFSLKTASLFASGEKKKEDRAVRLFEMGVNRLSKTIRHLDAVTNPVIADYRREQRGWDIFYDVLDAIEKGLRANDRFSLDLRRKAEVLAADCRLAC